MRHPRGTGLAALLLPAFLAACGPVIPRAAVTPPPPATAPVESALYAGVRPGPALGGLGLRRDDALGALVSFRESCPRMLARRDASHRWLRGCVRAVCTAADDWGNDDPRDFFRNYFETAQVSDGGTLVTGYYEPEIAGVRRRQPGFDVPVYGLPPDLVRARPGEAAPFPDGRPPLGRYGADGKFIPYFDRADIEGGALMGRGLEIAWAADPVEFFFLQVQGSGRLRAPDGSAMRLGFAGQNGQLYTGIGSLMRERGLIGDAPCQAQTLGLR